MRRSVNCAYCGRVCHKETGAINRAIKAFAPIYCNKECAGFGRRHGRTKEESKQRKKIYDNERRILKADEIKAKKAAAFKAKYNPVEAAIYRKNRMHKHLEYCRRPEYKAWKREYDREYLGKKEYGDFWEAYILVNDLNKEVKERMTDYEIRQLNETNGKRQKRKIEYDRLNSN